jgi:hypothetical protein
MKIEPRDPDQNAAGAHPEGANLKLIQDPVPIRRVIRRTLSFLFAGALTLAGGYVVYLEFFIALPVIAGRLIAVGGFLAFTGASCLWVYFIHSSGYWESAD